jgi:hypothetical protein
MAGFSGIFIIAMIVLLIVVLFVGKWMLGRGLRGLRRRSLMTRYDHPEFVASIMDGQIMRGMTMDMVVDVWGDPADLDEIALKTKTKTEMKYDQKGKNRFGTRVHLEDGIVVGWETK